LRGCPPKLGRPGRLAQRRVGAIQTPAAAAAAAGKPGSILLRTAPWRRRKAQGMALRNEFRDSAQHPRVSSLNYDRHQHARYQNSISLATAEPPPLSITPKMGARSRRIGEKRGALSCCRCALRVAVRRGKDSVCRCDALQCSTDVFALRRREVRDRRLVRCSFAGHGRCRGQSVRSPSATRAALPTRPPRRAATSIRVG